MLCKLLVAARWPRLVGLGPLASTRWPRFAILSEDKDEDDDVDDGEEEQRW